MVCNGVPRKQSQPGLLSLSTEILQMIAQEMDMECWIMASMACKRLWELPLAMISNQWLTGGAQQQGVPGKNLTT